MQDADIDIMQLPQEPIATNERKLLFLTPGEWLATVVLGTLCTVVNHKSYGPVSEWIGVGLFLWTIVAAHLVFSAESLLPIPHLAVLVGGLGYIIAPWLSAIYVTVNPAYHITNPTAYFNYAGPLFCAITVGWFLPLCFLRKVDALPRWQLRIKPDLQLLFDGFIIVGTVLQICDYVYSLPLSLKFIIILISNLRYVGVIGWLLARKPGWKARASVVFLVEAYLAGRMSMFLSLVLWGMNFFVCYIHIYRPSRYITISVLTFGLVLIPGMQIAKTAMRNTTWFDAEELVIFGSPIKATAVTKSVYWPAKSIETTIDLLRGRLSEEAISESLIRYNQGWIIDRIMEVVPTQEPFANGDTIVTALEGVVVPRVFRPDKQMAGGAVNFARFTGLPLTEGTSMNLGYAGEMYANFGVIGGIMGCGLYALSFGAAYTLLVRSASKRVLILAFIPYIFSWVSLMEVGFSEVVNFTAKAAGVSIILLVVVPSLKAYESGEGMET